MVAREILVPRFYSSTLISANGFVGHETHATQGLLNRSPWRLTKQGQPSLTALVTTCNHLE